MVIVQTEDGEQLAVYRGISLDMASRVIGFLSWVLGSAKIVGDIRTKLAGVLTAVERANAAPRRRGRR